MNKTFLTGKNKGKKTKKEMKKVNNSQLQERKIKRGKKRRQRKNVASK